MLRSLWTALLPAAEGGLEEWMSLGCTPASSQLGGGLVRHGTGGWASREGTVKCVLHGISEAQTASFLKDSLSQSRATLSGPWRLEAEPEILKLGLEVRDWVEVQHTPARGLWEVSSASGGTARTPFL